jgi:hypothetical protein
VFLGEVNRRNAEQWKLRMISWWSRNDLKQQPADDVLIPVVSRDGSNDSNSRFT